MTREEQLKRWDKDHVWHPFTQMKDWLEGDPLVIDRGQGNWLIDVDENRYLDGVSSLWVNVHGHNHPDLNQALKSQIDQISHSTLLGLANVPSITLAKRLVDLTTSNLTKVFYSDSGSTSVEIALKMAFQYWQQREPDQTISDPKMKTRFLSLSQAYHGDTIGSVSVGGIDLFHQIYHPLLFETIRLPSPNDYRPEISTNSKDEFLNALLKETEAILIKHHNEVAALVMEPLMQGAAGMLTAPNGYLNEIAKLCQRYQILLILDEVATGFGRTGKMFAYEHEDVQPDFLCLAKGLTGGYLPLAATVTTQKVFDGFCGEVSQLKTFFHGHTYTGNQLACAVALANLDLFEREGFGKSCKIRLNY